MVSTTTSQTSWAELVGPKLDSADKIDEKINPDASNQLQPLTRPRRIASYNEQETLACCNEGLHEPFSGWGGRGARDTVEYQIDRAMINRS